MTEGLNSKRNLIETYSRSSATYYKKELLGYGSFASVFRHVDTRTGKSVSIKLYVYPQVVKNGWRSRLHQSDCLLRQEIYLMTSIRHPNILACTDMYYRREYKSIDFGIVTSLATCDFTAYVKSKSILIDKRKIYMQQFLSAITFLHQCGYLHCDLKLDNILYFEGSDSLKLADFGICLPRTRYKAGDISLRVLHCSPVATRAPELLEHSYILKTEYRDFWLTLPPGCKSDPSIEDLYKCECYSIGHVLLELYLWREVEIFESKNLWNIDLDLRLAWIRARYSNQTIDEADTFDLSLEETIAKLMDVSPETRLTDLSTIPWRVDIEGTQVVAPIRALDIEFKPNIKKGIHHLYIELVRRKERIYTLGQAIGLYYRILNSNPLLIFEPDEVAICAINLVIIKRNVNMNDENFGVDKMDYIMELMLSKFIHLKGLIYTRTIDTLTTDSYLAWKSLNYYVEPELMMEYTPIEYLKSIPDSDIERIDIHADLLEYIKAYGELNTHGDPC